MTLTTGVKLNGDQEAQDLASSTIGCSFEYGETCFLDNDSGDQFDWSFASVR
jgi:hypothetical protein